MPFPLNIEWNSRFILWLLTLSEGFFFYSNSWLCSKLFNVSHRVFVECFQNTLKSKFPRCLIIQYFCDASAFICDSFAPVFLSGCVSHFMLESLFCHIQLLLCVLVVVAVHFFVSSLSLFLAVCFGFISLFFFIHLFIGMSHSFYFYCVVQRHLVCLFGCWLACCECAVVHSRTSEFTLFFYCYHHYFLLLLFVRWIHC